MIALPHLIANKFALTHDNTIITTDVARYSQKQKALKKAPLRSQKKD